MRKLSLALCFDLSRQQVLDEKVWLPLIPSGALTGNDGRSWINSNPDAVVASFKRKRPFDIEHSTHLKGPKGEKAPAVGWILALQNRGGEVWGMVDWNSEGSELLEKKQYAFYSPAFNFDLAGNVTSIASCGLTNEPNLDELPALNREETTMPLPVELTQALGLSADAQLDAALTAITTLKSDRQLAMNRAAAAPDLSLFIPKETHELALNRATAAETKLQEYQEQEVTALVDDAIAAGKVAPANRDMYLGLCRSEQGRSQFADFVKSAPVIAGKDPTKQTKAGQQGQDGLTQDELALCRAMGVKPETWAANRHHKPTY